MGASWSLRGGLARGGGSVVSAGTCGSWGLTWTEADRGRKEFSASESVSAQAFGALERKLATCKFLLAIQVNFEL